MLLFFTGFSRFSSDIQQNTVKALKDKEAELKEMTALVYEAETLLLNENASLDEFGRMLDHTWRLKRGISSGITTGSIDEMYEAGLRAGALGGKLLGAGGGGFLLFYVDKEHRNAVMDAMKELLYIPFSFEDEGTAIIHDEQESYDKADR